MSATPLAYPLPPWIGPNPTSFFGGLALSATAVADATVTFLPPLSAEIPWGAKGQAMKLKAFAILCTAAMAIVLPSETKYEAAIAAAPAGPDQTAPLPEFVSLTNRSEFLLASRGTAFVSPDSRQAAEALSSKFAEHSETARAVVTTDPTAALDPQNDPKSHIQLVAFAETGALIAPDPKGWQDHPKQAKLKPTVRKRTALEKPAAKVRTKSKQLSKSARSKLAAQGTAHQRQHRHSSATARKKPSVASNDADRRTDPDQHVGFLGLFAEPMPWN
jgi:hypothetical protein